MPKIHVGLYDDKALSIRVGSVGAAGFATTVDLIKRFPERRYHAAHKLWLVPITALNLDHLHAMWGPEEMEIDAEARTALDYTQKMSSITEAVTATVHDYQYSDAVPVLSFTPKTPSYKHQTVALAALHRSEAYGLLMEMGTGKTKVVIDEMSWRAGEGTGPYRALVVCPRSIMGVWARELERHAGVEYWTGILETGKRGEKTLLTGMGSPAPLKVWVTTYERIGALLPMLKNVRLDLVVLDESTRIKNPKAARTKAILALRDLADRRVIMTGTPVANSILDLWSQFEFLEPGALGYQNFYRFRDRYAILKENRFGYTEIVGFKNTDELKQRMVKISFTVKKEKCLDLPPKIYETRDIQMVPAQARLYHEMVNEMMVTLAETTSFAQTAAVLLIRLAQICGGFTKNADGSVADIEGAAGKLYELGDILDEVSGPVVVWARFRHDIERIEKYLADKKVGYVTIHGGISEEGRADAVEAFNAGRARVLIGEPGTGGLGLTLLGPERDRCHTAVYYSNDFSLEKRLQSEDRCHRIGQTLPVTYIDLAMEDSVEQKIAGALQEKKSLSEFMKDMNSMQKLIIGGIQE